MRTLVVDPIKLRFKGAYQTKQLALAYKHPNDLLVTDPKDLERELTLTQMRKMKEKLTKKEDITFRSREDGAEALIKIMWQAPVEERTALIAQVRDFFMEGGIGDAQEIADALGVEKLSVQLVISYVQNPEYCGLEGPLPLMRNSKKQWLLDQ